MRTRTIMLLLMLLLCVSSFYSCAPRVLTWSNPADSIDMNTKIPKLVRAWTRHVQLHDRWATTLDADAVYLGWELRKRLLEERISNEKMEKSKADALRKREEDLFNGYIVFYIAVFTTKDEWNNLDEEKPSWNIFFQNGEKKLFPSFEREKLSMDDALRFACFPDITKWETVYKVRFLRKVDGVDILTENPRELGLLFKGYLGEVLLEWNVHSK